MPQNKNGQLQIHQLDAFRVIVLRVIESFVYKSLEETISLIKMTTLINNNPLIQLVRQQIKETNPQVECPPKVTIRDVILSITKIFHSSEIQILANNDNFKIKLSKEEFQSLVDELNKKYSEGIIERIKSDERDYLEKLNEIALIEKGELDSLIIEQHKRQNQLQTSQIIEEEIRPSEQSQETLQQTIGESVTLSFDKQSSSSPQLSKALEAEDKATALLPRKNEIVQKAHEDSNGAEIDDTKEKKSNGHEVEIKPKEESVEVSEQEVEEKTPSNTITENEEKLQDDFKDDNGQKKRKVENDDSNDDDDNNDNEDQDNDDDDEVSIEEPLRKKPKLDNTEQHIQPNKKLLLVSNPLLASISSYKYASAFLQPVSESNAPDYYSLIKQPRDLKTIKQMIKDGRIQDNVQLERDILLMYANAIMYNKTGTDIYEWAKEMQVETDKMLQLFKDTT